MTAISNLFNHLGNAQFCIRHVKLFIKVNTFSSKDIEKPLDITSQQRKVYQNHNEVPLHTEQEGYNQKEII